jgi:hypothetical protein
MKKKIEYIDENEHPEVLAKEQASTYSSNQ